MGKRGGCDGVFPATGGFAGKAAGERVQDGGKNSAGEPGIYFRIVVWETVGLRGDFIAGGLGGDCSGGAGTHLRDWERGYFAAGFPAGLRV